MANSSEKVSIIGGSIAGLFAAISLKSKGFKITIYEKSEGSLESRGAGIATHKEIKKASKILGKEPPKKIGVSSVGRQLIDKNGTIAKEIKLNQQMTSWGLLYRFLKEAIPEKDYKTGYHLKNVVKNHGNSVKLAFENGEIIETDWAIGADGMNSTLRPFVDKISNPIYSKYLAWRGLVKETEIGEKNIELLDNKMSFGIAPRGHWLGYFVAGPNDSISIGERWYNWVWYRGENVDSLKSHLTGTNNFYYQNGIPHHLIKNCNIAKMRNEAKSYLAPQIIDLISETQTPFLQGIYDFASKKLVRNRIIIIGDAAFTARPHVGLGVYKASEDAISLADALLPDKNRIDNLKNWEINRLKFGKAAYKWGKDLGSYISTLNNASDKSEKELFFQNEEVLITQNASNQPNRYLKRYE